MMPKVLWETTLNPRTRRLLRVEISDQIMTDRVINEFMGKDPVGALPFHHGARRRSRGTGCVILIANPSSLILNPESLILESLSES